MERCWLFCTWDAATVATCDLNIHVNMWDTGSNPVISESLIVVICYGFACLIAVICLLYSSIIFISLWRGCIVSWLHYVNCSINGLYLFVALLNRQCHSGSGVRRVACGIPCCVRWHVSMPVLVHGHLATVMTAAVFLLKTFISLPTYYYYYYHVLLSYTASPPLFLWF